MTQHKNPNAMIAVESLHAALTFVTFKKKANENGLEYNNRVISARTKEVTATVGYEEESHSSCRITTNSEPHGPEEP